jgi:hypothetical protein
MVPIYCGASGPLNLGVFSFAQRIARRGKTEKLLNAMTTKITARGKNICKYNQ